MWWLRITLYKRGKDRKVSPGGGSSFKMEFLGQTHLDRFPSQLFGRLCVGHVLTPRGYGYSFRLVPGGPDCVEFLV